MPMTVEYRNGVQSSTISYSNMVIPEGITDNIHPIKCPGTGFKLSYLKLGDVLFRFHGDILSWVSLLSICSIPQLKIGRRLNM